MNKIKILNIDICNIACEELLSSLSTGLLLTPNVDHLVKLQKDRDFYNIYHNAEWIVCDSQIIRLFSKLLGSPLKEAIPGSSFFPRFCDYNKDNEHVRIFLLGAAPGVAHTAMEAINARTGREIVVGAHSPSFSIATDREESGRIVEMINATGATVLVVGLGAPKQEKWIAQYRNQLGEIELFMALGATIDFEAGNIKRAPRIIRKAGLEWLFRLAIDPKRLFKRYFVDDMAVFRYIYRQKRGLYHNPFD